MTGRRIYLILMFIAAIIAAASCRKGTLTGDGEGRIVLSLNSSHALRMETKTDAEDLLDGSRFDNLLVILTDNSGKVVKTFYKDDYATPQTQYEIDFDHLLPGNYHAYAYANIDATQWQQTGANAISSKEGALSTGDSFSFIDREMLGLTTAGRDAPASPVTSMLLTGKLDIPVGLSVVEAELNLLRPVVRFKVTVRNNTRFPVAVSSLEFSPFNPDKGYLIDHLNPSGIPSVPDGVTYRELPAFDPSDPSATVAAMTTGTVYTTYLYENVAPGTYKIFATVTMDRSGEILENLSYTLGGKPFGPIDAATLNAMNEGETLDVLLINPRSAVRSGRLYYGIGASGYTAWESCGYSSFNGFQARAAAIYDQNNSAFTYTGFTYNGPANNKSGLAGWTGDDADAPATGSTFNYVGKRSTYFHTLTKGSGNLFTLDGIATGSPASGASLSNIRIEKGKNVSGKFPDDIDENVLLRIYQSASGSSKLKSDNAWSATTVADAKYSYLAWDTDDNQDHQFVLFGKFDDLGAALKRILTENKKEVPLTYMARNEEINVILNVFYADQDGSLVFEVDNDHWTDENATSSSHTFN
jgi:hypothetical protein